MMSMPVNTTEIAERIAETHGLPKSQAKAVVESVLGEITDAVRKGEEVVFSGFGKFKVRDMPEREGRNPATGEVIRIAAMKKLVFLPSKALKDAANG
jgi:DNA-binding protein HU-beta